MISGEFSINNPMHFKIMVKALVSYKFKHFGICLLHSRKITILDPVNKVTTF